MWVNPKYRDIVEQPQSPVERGERVLTLPRGKDEELRVSVDEYNGHRFVSMRVWARGSDGSYWPLKGKGLSVRIRELRGIGEVFLRAADEMGEP